MRVGLSVDRGRVKRRAIQVIKSRLEDIEVGDVVNRDPDAEMGWFEVDAISILFNGHVQLADVTEQLTVSGNHKDLVGIQLVEEKVLDENGNVVSNAAPMMVASGVMAAPAAADAPTAPPAESGAEESTAPEPAAPTIPAALDSKPTTEVDLAAEAAAAAAIATEMDAPTPGAGGRATPDVDLALVASLLENLDVDEEAPAISTEISGEPLLPEPAPLIPEGAVAVDGGALPDKPSYKNPVVVPEGTMLPRRSRGAAKI